VHAGYPPTLLIHGDQDRDVPHSLSANMAAALAAVGVEQRLRILKGYGHVFDDAFDQPAVIEAFVEILGFLSEHLQD